MLIYDMQVAWHLPGLEKQIRLLLYQRDPSRALRIAAVVALRRMSQSGNCSFPERHG